MGETTKNSVTRRRKLRHTSELLTAVILSLGGVATTFCSYEAALWSGQQSFSYSRAGVLRTEATNVATRGGQITSIDVASFVAWLQADLTGQAKLERALRGRLRKGFLPVFEEWRAQNPLENPGAPPTPFMMPGYHPTEQARAEKIAQEAEALFAEGQHANAVSDDYSMITVIFAMALFFAGIGGQFKRPALVFTVLAMSALLVTGGVLRLTQLPRASRGEAEEAAPQDTQHEAEPRAGR